MSLHQQIVQVIEKIPPLPDVAIRILQIVYDPDFSTDELVAVVRTDPVLTGKILKLCNSSIFAVGREITRISDAVAYLGTRNLVKLVVVACTAPYYRNVDAGYFLRAGEIWRHSVACALAAQIVAFQAELEDPAAAFTAGILHNIGKVALSCFLIGEQQALRSALSEGTDDFIAIERRIAGMDHASAGGVVADRWFLPPNFRRAIRNHHSPEHIAQDGDLTAVVHLADVLVLQLGVGGGIDGMNYPICTNALDKLRILPKHLDTLRLRILDELKRSEDLIKLG